MANHTTKAQRYNKRMDAIFAKSNALGHTSLHCDKEKSKPEIHERQIIICEHTKKEVVAEWEGDHWLCLHNETEKQDALEVANFIRLHEHGRA